jgi:predicted nucleotidyltransferase component of viral defense system
MLELKEIEKLYPENVRLYKKNILREYLQYKILEKIFKTRYSTKLSFIGGTALRIVHNSSRFSEDIDFNNFDLSQVEFENLSISVKREMELEGFKVERRNTFKESFRCYFKILNILYENNISDHPHEKLLIQIDTISQGIDYKSEKVLLNKFDVFTQIRITPLDILLSQKIWTIFNRKRDKGRDYFDIVFLLSRTKPNYYYLKKKLNINNPEDLKKKLLSKCESTDFNKLAKDIEPFAINPGELKRVTLFGEYIKRYDL